MSYQKLYATLDDGYGIRGTHSMHAKVERIKGWVNSQRGEVLDFVVQDYEKQVNVKIKLANASNFVIEEVEGIKIITFEIDKPRITNQERKTGEL